MHSSLGAFVAALQAAGELHRVRVPVSPLLEISEIADRQSKAPCPVVSEHARVFDPDHADRGGKALLFEQVEGCDFPVLINSFGSYRRMEMALGHDFESIAARIGSLVRPQPPRSFSEWIARAREFLPLLRVAPRHVSAGPCQDVVRLASKGEVDLFRLPILKCWPFDGDPTSVGSPITAEQAGTAAGQGRYITLAGVHTIHADDAGSNRPSSHNIGMYRLQLVDGGRLALHAHLHHDGAAHWRSWKARGERMPVAVCLGGESFLPYAASCPLPPGIGELMMAGFLGGRGIPLVEARTVPLRVPANSEIVIEGFVSTAAGGPGWDPGGDEPLGEGAVFEGPFGDHTGFYSLPDRYPVMEVTAITHRHDAIYPTTIVGLPPQEDYYLGKATERIMLPLLRTLIHDIVDYHLPLFGCFHNCAFLKIRKDYPLQARRVMCSVWGAGQMAWTKVIVVVDDDVDVHDEQAVWRAVFSNCDFLRDLEFVNGPLDILDHAAPRLAAGHKLGIDATRKVSGEEVSGVAIDAPRDGCRPVEHPDVAYPGFGNGRCAFVRVAKERPGDGVRALEHLLAAGGADFAIAVDEGVDLADPGAVFFRWTANSDPGRDLVRDGHRVGFDATAKIPGEERGGQPVRDFPPVLEMDASTRERVDRRWQEYGFQPEGGA